MLHSSLLSRMMTWHISHKNYKCFNNVPFPSRWYVLLAHCCCKFSQTEQLETTYLIFYGSGIQKSKISVVTDLGSFQRLQGQIHFLVFQILEASHILGSWFLQSITLISCVCSHISYYWLRFFCFPRGRTVVITVIIIDSIGYYINATYLVHIRWSSFLKVLNHNLKVLFTIWGNIDCWN